MEWQTSSQTTVKSGTICVSIGPECVSLQSYHHLNILGSNRAFFLLRVRDESSVINLPQKQKGLERKNITKYSTNVCRKTTVLQFLLDRFCRQVRQKKQKKKRSRVKCFCTVLPSLIGFYMMA